MMLLFVLAAVLAASQAVLVPGPPGPFHVAMRVQGFTDTSRPDPYAPKDKPHPRRVLISMFLPLEPWRKYPVELVPYMPPRTAKIFGDDAAALGLPNDTFARFELEVSKLPIAGAKRKRHHEHHYPLVLFSPGFGGSRLANSAGAMALASKGYVVVTIDHPYDASIVEFPDGDVFLRNISIVDPADVVKPLEVRAADTSFIIDQLHNPSVLRKLTDGYPGQVDVEKPVMYGHSLGGATAAAAMLSDDRILGGMNLDGHMFGPVVQKGLDRPFILTGILGRDDVPGSHWPEFYDNVRSAKMDLSIANTTHTSFIDAQLLFTAIDIPDKLKPGIDAFLGSLDGRRLEDITLGILRGFLDLVFRAKAGVLRNIGKDFCEVTVVKSSLPG
ncbi:Platelet-activating factor acetylhydrolase [Tolypocladium ophioglossoides CBS 100239]|uniref:1-alkyl-2-acetylglycerophosphocholine esterase n=1 Tax=Tolypocladium ophioglossoides (strain CBS 100239) TaxID=1163406 RepID=A0A0L0N5R2_TOLOC|nr:Platelet-activating factor acetylhydrolase [Tolypocladium ophioglossoides CBS 100239]